MSGAPGFRKHPDYAVTVTPTRDHIRVLAGNTVIADTRRPLQVAESRHHPVWYLPLQDVARDRITPTDHTTYCPFKGHARYWTLTCDGEPLDNAMWSYPEPYDECAALAGHVAFYTDRVDLEVNGVMTDRQGPGWSD